LLVAFERRDLCFKSSDALIELLFHLDQRRCESLVLDLLAPLIVDGDELREDISDVLGDDTHVRLLLDLIGCVVAPLPGVSSKPSDS
jgi:hypothetical protein